MKPNDYYVGKSDTNKIDPAKMFKGLNTYNKDLTSLEDGETPDELNWLTGNEGDHIELTGGVALLGTTRVAGNGAITGLGVATKPNGSQIPFFSYAQKIKYYNGTDTVEVGSNLLPTAAKGEDVSFAPYNSISGYWMFISSQNSSIYKIGTANPASALDLKSITFRGLMKIKQNRSFLWSRYNKTTGFKDLVGLNLSYVDKATYGAFSNIANETVGAGDSATKTFTHTMAQATGFQTVFNILAVGVVTATTNITAITKVLNPQITSASHGLVAGDTVWIQGVTGMTQINSLLLTVNTVVDVNNFTVLIDASGYTTYSSGGTVGKAEYFADAKDGTISSNLGGTGTINYATGALSLTFNTAPITGTNISANYLYEDSTVQGIADFTSSGSRTVGQGDYFLQADDGNFMNSFSFGSDEYCFHVLKTWILTLTANDTNATNLIYRGQVGIPYWRAGQETGSGIVYLDYTDQNWPAVRRLEYNQFSTAIVPTALSGQLDLTQNGFDYPVIKDWANYIILACQGITNGVNDTGNDVMYAMNHQSGFWDKLNYRASCLDEYKSNLIAGDSISDNVFTLFSGEDYDGSSIPNFWSSKKYNLAIDGLKRFYRFLIYGFINTAQNFDIYLAYDNGLFSKVATINGNGSYVNTGVSTTVGSQTVGQQAVGGGATPNAFEFRKEFLISSDVFEYVRVQFVATAIGALQINYFAFRSVVYKGQRTINAFESEV